MRFIHIADIHLGAEPDAGSAYSKSRPREIWNSLERICGICEEEGTDLLLIAGDLFHRQPLLRELKEVNACLGRMRKTQVALIIGNHDYLKRDSFYRGFQWEPNVTFFDQEEVTCVRDEKLGVCVYGMSYHSQEIRENLYDPLKPEGVEGFHVLLAHGGDEKHIPIDAAALAGAGFDYIALGHIHKPQALIKDTAVYAGALEPIDRNDLGPHGYVEGRYENGQVKTNFVPFACRSYQQILLTLREDSTQFSLEEMLKGDIMKKGGRNIYRVILQGVRSPEFMVLTEKLKVYGNITEVLDESRPAYDLEELLSRYRGTLIGDYIQYFLDKKRTSVEEKALYYGLQALLETSR